MRAALASMHRSVATHQQSVFGRFRKSNDSYPLASGAFLKTQKRKGVGSPSARNWLLSRTRTLGESIQQMMMRDVGQRRKGFGVRSVMLGYMSTILASYIVSLHSRPPVTSFCDSELFMDGLTPEVRFRRKICNIFVDAAKDISGGWLASPPVMSTIPHNMSGPPSLELSSELYNATVVISPSEIEQNSIIAVVSFSRLGLVNLGCLKDHGFVETGFYVLLFGTCVHMMHRHHQRSERLNHHFYLTLSVVLFVLSTMFVVVYTMIDVGYAIVKSAVDDGLQRATVYSIQQLVAVLLNTTADCMLIHRCYLIWNSDKCIALPLILASAVINGVGIGCSILHGLSEAHKLRSSLSADTICVMYYISTAVVESVLTLLTAGRIWWIHRAVHAHGIGTSDTFIRSITRIILESGIIYPIFSIATMIIAKGLGSPFDPFPLVPLSGAIVPTLILVQVQLGKNVESLQNM
ncbi:hypothetical protein WG66_005636 [Moniliophthora roreri]|nr:hypothetical protein WG66_005636 [Moniliophthora roreri]